jgi:phosphoribosylaminoimidazole carboxylase (NCAIR synthetase)
VADEQIVGSFTDPAMIKELAAKCDVLTVEIEHVNAEALAAAAAAAGKPVHPSPSTVALIQDKLRQKEAMRARGVPVGDFRPVASAADVLAAAEVRTAMRPLAAARAGRATVAIRVAP